MQIIKEKGIKLYRKRLENDGSSANRLKTIYRRLIALLLLLVVVLTFSPAFAADAEPTTQSSVTLQPTPSSVTPPSSEIPAASSTQSDTLAIKRINPFEFHYSWNLEPQVGLAPWCIREADCGAFFARLGAGLYIANFEYIVTVNGTVGYRGGFFGGVQASFTSLGTGLWTQLSVEMAAGPSAFMGIGVGFTIVGVEYQQTFTNQFDGTRGLIFLIRIPIGAIYDRFKD